MSEDLKPIVQEEEQSAAVSEQIVENPIDETIEETLTKNITEVSGQTTEVSGQVDFSTMGLKEVIDYFQNLIEKGDMQLLYRYAEVLKAAFYKTLKREKIAIGYQSPAEDVVEGESESVEQNVSNNPFAELERGFKQLYSQYRASRASYLQDLEKKKEENLKLKLEVIEELKSLLEKQEDLNRTYPEFRAIQTRWKLIGPVPQNKVKDVYETYQHCVEMFYDYVKINKELRDLDFKKNLESKEQLCVAAEALQNEENIVSAFRSLQKLHEEWKDFGPVDKEYRESIWERFKTATSLINKRHQEYFESQKGNQKKNYEDKCVLCEKVEAISVVEVNDSNTWNTLSKEIENIQKEWKKIGFAAKKDNQKVYDRFRAACDSFYSKKREFYSEFKDQMQENMEKKIALCEQAESLMESEDWKKTSDLLIGLQKQWKEIGPVSRKKSEQIWKRFRAACDAFFDKREKHFGEQDSQYEENLAKKRAIIDQINEYTLSDDKQENLDAMRAFHAKWNEVGFVPFKEKTKIQEAYKTVVDSKFSGIVSAGGESRINRYNRRFSEPKVRNGGVRSERERLVLKFVKKEQDIATWENNMGFFSKSKNADALLEELNKKIDIAKEELAQIEEKIKTIDKQYEE
ncbi:MAG: DUF349 domain-containing protein [Bacteroidales bacterium]